MAAGLLVELVCGETKNRDSKLTEYGCSTPHHDVYWIWSMQYWARLQHQLVLMQARVVVEQAVPGLSTH